MRITISGTYSTGKTTMSLALSLLTGIPSTFSREKIREVYMDRKVSTHDYITYNLNKQVLQNKFTIMKRNSLLLLTMLLATSISNAQNSIHVIGKVYEKNRDKVNAYVPFASVYYYNYEDSTKLEYFAFADLSGQYDLGKIVVKKYRIKVIAPGYQIKRKNVGNLPTEIPKEWKSDNLTIHLEMKRDIDDNTVNPSVFFTKNLKQSSKNNFWDLIKQINGLIIDQKTKTITTKNGNPIRLLLNGFTMKETQFEKINSLPIEGFKQFEYYDLSKQSESLYGAVVNIVLITGNQAQKVDFQPKEYYGYDIK